MDILTIISTDNKSINFKNINVQYFIMRKIYFIFLKSKNNNNNRRGIGRYE